MIEEIKAQAKGRWKEILIAFGFTEQQLSGRHGPCSICGGKDRARWIADKERYFCNQCSERSRDGIQCVMDINGFTFVQAKNELANYLCIAKLSYSQIKQNEIKRQQAIKAEKKRQLEEYHSAKEFTMMHHWAIKDKYREKNIDRLDECSKIIRDYELKHPNVINSKRSKVERKFWNRIAETAMAVDTKYIMLVNYMAGILIDMKNSGKTKKELAQAFYSIANKSNYRNDALKQSVFEIMRQPEKLEKYTLEDLKVKKYSDDICAERTREKRAEMLADVPEKLREAVAESVAIEFKLKRLMS